MKVDRNILSSLVPHAGDMCLLDCVEAWDELHIVCSARSHLSTDNPLRSDGRLTAIHALEYGAQAVAVHGGLTARQQRKRISEGYVAAVRDACFYVERLDLLESDLTVEARQLITSDDKQIYRVIIRSADLLVAEARLMVKNSTEPIP